MIYAIVGPTGVGKTKLSIMLAKKLDAEIINCDSMQIYKELNIGVAKIKEEEKEGITHELFDIVDVNEMFTVYDYQKKARELINKYKDRNLIFVGGTGLYIKAALYDYKFNEENDSDFSNLSNEELYELCLKKDSSCSIHINNRKRMERFLKRENEENNKNILLYDAIFIGLTTERSHLYEIINKRVDKMVEEGLLEEVKKFYEQNIRSKAIMTGIGYKELYKYFDGELSLEESLDLIKQNSRKYAKRQYTWFNNQMNINWFTVNFDNFNKTVEEVIEFIEERE